MRISAVLASLAIAATTASAPSAAAETGKPKVRAAATAVQTEQVPAQASALLSTRPTAALTADPSSDPHSIQAQRRGPASDVAAVSVSQSCDQVKQHLADYAGHNRVSCVEATPKPLKASPAASANQSATQAVLAGSATCNAATQVYNRFEVCNVMPFSISVFQVSPPSPVPIGSLVGTIYDDFVLTRNQLTYVDYVTVHFSSISASVQGMFGMTHTATCVSALASGGTPTCTPTSNFPNGAAPSTSNDINTSVNVVDTIPSTGNGVTDNSLKLSLDFIPTNPQVLLPADIQYTPAVNVSCDNLLTRVGPGCSLPQFWPTLTTMTQLPHIAYNIKRIQDGSTSHPGQAGYGTALNPYGNPNGIPLHRDEENRDANNAVACPASRPNPNPDVLECDEYPFATALEGASLPGIPATEWGWAWVPASEQRSQGGLLGGFGGLYDKNRLLDSDAYWVDVSGATPQPPLVGGVTLTSGLTDGGTYSATVAVTATAPPADAFYYHVQRSGADVLVSPSIPGTPGTNNHTWQFDTTALPNGQYQVYGAATLGGSLVGVSPIMTVTIRNAPKITIDSGLVNGGTYGHSPVTVTGTATPGSDYFYFHFQQGGIDKLVSPTVPGTPGTTSHSWLFDPTVLTDGAYQVFATAILGGVSGQSPTITITIANSATPMAIAGMKDGTSQFAVIGGDGILYHEVRDVNANLSGLQPVMDNNGHAMQAKAVAISGTPDGSTQLLVEGADGLLYWGARYPSGTWTGWSPIPGINGPTVQVKALSIAGMSDGTSQLAIIGGDGILYHEVRGVNANLSGLQPVTDNNGNAMQAKAVAISGTPDGSTQLLVNSADGLLYWGARYPSGTWTGWSPIPGINGPTVQVKALSITGMKDGTSQFAVIGGDVILYHEIRDGNANLSGLQPVMDNNGNAMQARAVAISGTPDGATQLLVEGADGLLYWGARYPSGTWTGWSPVPGINGQPMHVGI